MKYQNIREEELKNKVAKIFFGCLIRPKLLGILTFVYLQITQDALFDQEYLMWAEAK